jgi:hypothetical protein
MVDYCHWQYSRLVQRILFWGSSMAPSRAGVPPPRVDVSRIPSWILVAVNGFLALVALAALVGSAGLLTSLNEISSMLGV